MRLQTMPVAVCVFWFLLTATTADAQVPASADSAAAWQPILPRTWPARQWALVGEWRMVLTTTDPLQSASGIVQLAPDSVPAIFPAGLSHMCDRCLSGLAPNLWDDLGLPSPDGRVLRLRPTDGDSIFGWIGASMAIKPPNSIWMSGTWQADTVAGTWYQASVLPARSGLFRLVRSSD